jgi:hypothetical protein
MTQTGSATLQALPDTLNFTVTPTLYYVGKNTTYTFTLTLLDPISSSGRIMINFPPALTLSFTSTNCAIVVGINTISTPTCTLQNST